MMRAKTAIINLGVKLEMDKTPNLVLCLLVALTIVIGPMTLSSIAGKAAKQGTVARTNKKISQKIEEFKKRLDKLLSPVEYHYVAAGKPDPFRPFFRTEMKKSVASVSKPTPTKPDRCDTPLECMDVGQLTLVGIVLEPNGTGVAMAQDASGIGYTLRVGTTIGYNKGKVVAITRDKVVVKEKVEDLKGQPTFRDRILYLHPEEGDESR